ncbi:MAG TPA: hypothetical protein VIV66_05975 [Pyrinomonadaceae bacterium]
MKKLLTVFAVPVISLIYCSSSFCQTPATGNGSAPTVATSTVSITASTSPEELARIALTAQGGEKFRHLQNMILRGSVDLFAPNSTQSIPGGFVIVTAGDKIRIEIDARPAVSFKQIYDGQQSYSSIPGVELPPASKFGLSVLGRFDSDGFKVSAIPDKKKQRGFRITDPDGNATEFYVDSSTGRVMSFYIGYNGYTFATENKKFKDFDGVLIPVSFTQRLEMPQGAFFADYKVKDVRLNQQLSEDVFAIPN